MCGDEKMNLMEGSWNFTLSPSFWNMAKADFFGFLGHEGRCCFLVSKNSFMGEQLVCVSSCVSSLCNGFSFLGKGILDVDKHLEPSGLS